jgi:hypothetical protein
MPGPRIHVFWSTVLTQVVLLYSLFHCNDFKWGKTREVVEDAEEEKEILQTKMKRMSQIIWEGTKDEWVSIPSSGVSESDLQLTDTTRNKNKIG